MAIKSRNGGRFLGRPGGGWAAAAVLGLAVLVVGGPGGVPAARAGGSGDSPPLWHRGMLQDIDLARRIGETYHPQDAVEFLQEMIGYNEMHMRSQNNPQITGNRAQLRLVNEQLGRELAAWRAKASTAPPRQLTMAEQEQFNLMMGRRGNGNPPPGSSPPEAPSGGSPPSGGDPPAGGPEGGAGGEPPPRTPTTRIPQAGGGEAPRSNTARIPTGVEPPAEVPVEPVTPVEGGGAGGERGADLLGRDGDARRGRGGPHRPRPDPGFGGREAAGPGGAGNLSEYPDRPGGRHPRGRDRRGTRGRRPAGLRGREYAGADRPADFPAAHRQHRARAPDVAAALPAHRPERFVPVSAGLLRPARAGAADSARVVAPADGPAAGPVGDPAAPVPAHSHRPAGADRRPRHFRRLPGRPGRAGRAADGRRLPGRSGRGELVGRLSGRPGRLGRAADGRRLGKESQFGRGRARPALRETAFGPGSTSGLPRAARGDFGGAGGRTPAIAAGGAALRGGRPAEPRPHGRTTDDDRSTGVPAINRPDPTDPDGAHDGAAGDDARRVGPATFAEPGDEPQRGPS